MTDDRQTMLALTLIQPWATMIVHGPKRIENRTWAPPYEVVGQRIWIHAGKTFDDQAALDLVIEDIGKSQPTMGPLCDRAERELGVILGSVRVVGVLRDGVIPHCVFPPEQAELARELRGSPFWAGPVGWMLDDVRALERPVPCRGAQKLWSVPADVLEQLRAQR